MKSLLSASLILGVGAAATFSFGGSPRIASGEPTAEILATNTRLRFTKNMGQRDADVRFLGHAPGVDMSGVTYDYRQVKVTKPLTVTK